MTIPFSPFLWIVKQCLDIKRKVGEGGGVGKNEDPVWRVAVSTIDL